MTYLIGIGRLVIEDRGGLLAFDEIQACIFVDEEKRTVPCMSIHVVDEIGMGCGARRLARPAIGVTLREWMVEIAKELPAITCKLERLLEDAQGISGAQQAIAVQHAALGV